MTLAWGGVGRASLRGGAQRGRRLARTGSRSGRRASLQRTGERMGQEETRGELGARRRERTCGHAATRAMQPCGHSDGVLSDGWRIANDLNRERPETQIIPSEWTVCWHGVERRGRIRHQPPPGKPHATSANVRWKRDRKGYAVESPRRKEAKREKEKKGASSTFARCRDDRRCLYVRAQHGGIIRKLFVAPYGDGRAILAIASSRKVGVHDAWTEFSQEADVERERFGLVWELDTMNIATDGRNNGVRVVACMPRTWQARQIQATE